MWDLIVLGPDHCLSFQFKMTLVINLRSIAINIPMSFISLIENRTEHNRTLLTLRLYNTEVTHTDLTQKSLKYKVRAQFSGGQYIGLDKSLEQGQR